MKPAFAARKKIKLVFQQYIALIIFGLLVIFALAFYSGRNRHLIGPPIGKILGQDLRQVLVGAESIKNDENLYARALAFGSSPNFKEFMSWTAAPYPYSPLPATIALPFMSLPSETVLKIWTGVNFLLLILSSMIAVRSLATEQEKGKFSLYLLTFTLFFVFEPTQLGLMLVQLDILILFLLLLAYYLSNKSDSFLGGLSLGFAIALKPIVAPMVFYFIWKRKWKTTGGAILTSALLTISSFAIAGWNLLPAYLEVNRLWSTNAMLAYPFNQSAYGLALRLFTNNTYIHPLVLIPWLARVIQVGILILAVWAWFLAIRSDGKADQITNGIEFGFTLLCNMLISPLVEDNHMVWALIPLSALLLSSIALYQNKISSFPLVITLFLALYLAFPDLRDATYVGSGPLQESGVLVERRWIFFTGAYFYGLFALCIFTFYMLRFSLRKQTHKKSLEIA